MTLTKTSAEFKFAHKPTCIRMKLVSARPVWTNVPFALMVILARLAISDLISSMTKQLAKSTVDMLLSQNATGDSTWDGTKPLVSMNACLALTAVKNAMMASHAISAMKAWKLSLLTLPLLSSTLVNSKLSPSLVTLVFTSIHGLTTANSVVKVATSANRPVTVMNAIKVGTLSILAIKLMRGVFHPLAVKANGSTI